MKTKPSIDAVCLEFHRFSMRVAEALAQTPPMSETQRRALAEARGKLRASLIKMDLARHIDWSEDDGTN